VLKVALGSEREVGEEALQYASTREARVREGALLEVACAKAAATRGVKEQ
jgi:hypothetical protein